MTEPTLARIRGGIIGFGVDATPPGNFLIVVGMMVLNADSAASANVTPIADPDADWLAIFQMPGRVTAESTGTYWREIVDVRAKRRINQDDVVYLAMEECLSTIDTYGIVAGLSFLLRQV